MQPFEKHKLRTSRAGAKETELSVKPRRQMNERHWFWDLAKRSCSTLINASRTPLWQVIQLKCNGIKSSRSISICFYIDLSRISSRHGRGTWNKKCVFSASSTETSSGEHFRWNNRAVLVVNRLWPVSTHHKMQFNSSLSTCFTVSMSYKPF